MNTRNPPSSKQLKEASLLNDIAKLAALINNHNKVTNPTKKFSNLTLNNQKPLPVLTHDSPIQLTPQPAPSITKSPKTPKSPKPSNYVRKGNKLVRIGSSPRTKVVARYSRVLSPSILLKRKKIEMIKQRKKRMYSIKMKPKPYQNKLYVRTNHPPKTPTKSPTPTKARKIINGQVYVMTPRGKSMVRSGNIGRHVASNRVKQSLKNARKKPQYCMFFNKFGKCNNDKCKYVRDRDKVAVCMKFLKGKCEDANCLLQHKVDTDRMPVCWHFLKGMCTNENCIYSHVNVNPQAEICPDFAKGYCANGRNCKLKHISTNKPKPGQTETKNKRKQQVTEVKEVSPKEEKELEDVFVSIRPRFKRRVTLNQDSADEQFIDVNIADNE